jgi:hypothetical protein
MKTKVLTGSAWIITAGLFFWAPLKTRFFCDFLGDSGVYKEEVFDKRKKNKELVQKI